MVFQHIYYSYSNQPVRTTRSRQKVIQRFVLVKSIVGKDKEVM